MGFDAWTNADFAGSPLEDDPTIRRELGPGEKVVWQGRPQLGRLMIWSLPMALVGIPFSAFAVFWTVGASQAVGAPGAGFFWLFGIPFLLVGAGLVLSPLGAAWKGTKTRYALTDRRAIVCEPQFGFGIQTRSYAADALTRIIRNQRGDGSGDLIFEEVPLRSNRGRARTIQRGFFAITDVRGVETLLRSTLLAHRAGL